MHYRYFLHCMLGAASFACGGAPEPSVTVNRQFLSTQGQHEIGGGCGPYQRGQASPTTPFYHPSSYAPDLEIAEGFNGEVLTVTARTTRDTPGLPPIVHSRTYTFEFLISGERDSLLIDRAAGGIYELQFWGVPGATPKSCSL